MTCFCTYEGYQQNLKVYVGWNRVFNMTTTKTLWKSGWITQKTWFKWIFFAYMGW